MIKLTDEQINAIWSEKDTPLHSGRLSPFGLDRIRAIEAEVLRLNGGCGEALSRVKKWADGWAAIPYEDPWKQAAEEILGIIATAPQPHQAAPGAVLEGLLKRYEAMRCACVHYGNLHPDSKEVCHQALAKSHIPPLMWHLASLADDMALALAAAPSAPKPQGE